jgi:hypothetical protein
MRYRPRVELTRTLRSYDIIHVVTGSPAQAAAVMKADIPVVLQAATTAAWERESQFADQAIAKRAWRRGMMALTSRVKRSALQDVDVVLVENAPSIRTSSRPRRASPPTGSLTRSA